MNSKNKPVIGIVGLGVMGGSFAARLKELDYPVIGFDLDPETIKFALDNQLIDQGATNPKELLNECDALILCLYPTRLQGWIEENQEYLKENARIFEIGGVKSGLSDALHQGLREDVELISIHPMCGRESRGIRFSSPRIFDKANFIIIPHESNKEESLAWIHDLAAELGCRNINELSAAEHDRMIAFLSQLTHVIAVSLMNTHENAHLVDFSGDSFRELTRIAKINEKMWSELFLLNKDILLEEIESFEDSLDRFKTALKNEDAALMEDYFIESTKRRERFD